MGFGVLGLRAQSVWGLGQLHNVVQMPSTWAPKTLFKSRFFIIMSRMPYTRIQAPMWNPAMARPNEQGIIGLVVGTPKPRKRAGRGLGSVGLRVQPALHLWSPDARNQDVGLMVRNLYKPL